MEQIPRTVVEKLWKHRDPEYRNYESPDDCAGPFENPNFRIGFEERGYPHFFVYQRHDGYWYMGVEYGNILQKEKGNG